MKLMDSEQPMTKAESMKSKDMAKLTTPERAEKMLESMKERQAQQVEHVAALKDFYAVLTSEQKKVFDDFHSGSRDGVRAKSKHRASAPAKEIQKP
jgi:Spy/CpxP family protein refolding chaperone